MKKKPFFLLLLPLFFVLHGFTEHFNAIPVTDALLLLLIYTTTAGAIALIAWLFYRDWSKASLITLLILGFHFFFGSLQDVLRTYSPSGFISRYSFILPVNLLLFILFIAWLKKRKKPLHRITYFVNLLLLVFILIDTGWLLTKTTRDHIPGKAMLRLQAADSGKLPDIYLVILDEYASAISLQEKFDYDNTDFENELKGRGFHISTHSRSNYNYTPYSIASLLNMTYLDLNMKTKNPGNLDYCYRMIRNSSVVSILERNGYRFYNYSIFDFSGNPSISGDPFLAARTKLITSQTFTSRIWKDILFNVETGNWAIAPVKKKIVYSHLNNNSNFTRLTINEAARRDSFPKFVYTHLMMPHHPYYFNHKGEALPFDSLLEGRQYNKRNYVEYLRYCNQKILAMVDSIRGGPASPPVIILAGDHGFRYFREKANRQHCFMNLMAVYLPSENYASFYDSLSVINLFPVIFRDQFNQYIPLKKDSTIYLWD